VNGNPYSPPQAEVTDVQPAARSHGIRTFWFVLALLVWIVAVFFYGLEFLVPALTPALVAASAALGVLASFPALKIFVALRSAKLAWWSLALNYSVAGIVILGALIDAPALLAVGLLAFGASGILVLAMVRRIERRHDVRIYSRGRGYVLVRGEREL